MNTCRIVLCISIVVAQAAFATGACAHRGDTKHFPENTLPAFVSAVEKGAHQIEFDVQRTKDGELVLMHDATIDRTTDGTGKIEEMTFAEVRALDAGGWFNAAMAGTRVPAMREVLEVIPPAIVCNVHLKDSPGVAAAAAALIRDMDRLDQCFLACTLEQAGEAHAAVPEIRICNMSRQSGDGQAYVDSTIAAKSAFIQLHKSEGLDGIKDAVSQLHANGVLVNYFGTEDEPTIRILAGAGVDYILTDDLDLCLRVLAALPEKTAPQGSE
jgi:glycerophosphoryl diester phosphodiesterase